MKKEERIGELLNRIYGTRKGGEALMRLESLLQPGLQEAGLPTDDGPDEKEIVLITYGDSLRRPGQPPLQTLYAFASKYLNQVVSTIHFLPFFPYSSDNGFWQIHG